MPEGDVVRLTAERLGAALTGAPLVRAELRWPSAAGAVLDGASVTSSAAYGKHLLTRLDDGRTLHTHLRMDGTWHVHRTGTRDAAARAPDVRAVLATASWTCLGRSLGMLDLVPTREEGRLLAHLGPDVLGDGFLDAGLADGVRRLTAQGARPLAESLLDQRPVAGLGTIWTAETLFALRVWPWTPTDTLDAAALGRVLATAHRLMARSVQVGRARGLQAVERAVHGRARRPCRRCATTIAVGRAGRPPYDRPVYWCPGCQRPPAAA